MYEKFSQLRRWENAAGATVFGLVFLLLAVRLTRGVDFSDESYYAVFVDDWLKGSIATSTFLALHQTAALIVYPLARMYSAISRANDGLFLFLRVVFLAGAALSALLWTVFLQRLGYQRLICWMGGILILAFVPFGLPAPSYNTLGQQALTIALASFGCGALIREWKVEQLWWLILSACTWAVATVAYPSLIVPCGFLCLLVLLYRNNTFPRSSLFISLVTAAICIGWLLVLFSLSLNRFYEILVYHSMFAYAGSWDLRLVSAQRMLESDSLFSTLLVIAIIIGLVSCFYTRFLQVFFVAAIVCLFAGAPASLPRSHEAITLAALMGLGLLFGLRAHASREERIIACIYATSLIAAITMLGTAFYGINNFSVGATTAAAMACLGRPERRASGLVGYLPVAAAILAVMSTSLFQYYGETPSKTIGSRVRIENGFFKGLLLNPDDAALVHLMEKQVAPFLRSDQTVALIGRLPGLILLTQARLSMPIAWPLQSLNGKGLTVSQAFYQLPAHQPSVVLVCQDSLYASLNPILNFEDRYAVAAEFDTPRGRLVLFRRRQLGT